MMLQDLRYALRSLHRAPVFALTAVLVTALGVGATTAAFSVADFVLLRPLPFADPERLVRLCEGPRSGSGWGCMNQLSPANYLDFKAMSTSFALLGAFASDAANLVGVGEPRRIEITPVTPEVLPLMGVQPVLGRLFDASDADRSAVVLAFGLWQSQFGGNPAVLGRTIRLDGAPRMVIGVMPRGFYFPNRDIEIWTSLSFDEAALADRTNSYIEGIGRLARGATFEGARVELESIAARLAAEYPRTNADTGISFYRMRDAMSPRFRQMLIGLGGATLCLLLLTCASLTNLLLARAAAREPELAVRTALGAGTERLVRQLLTENIVLAIAGGIGGLVVAAASVPLFASLVPSSLPIDRQPGLDTRMLVVASLATALVCLGVGLIPAIRAGRHTRFDALREAGRGGSARRQRLRSALVTLEVALSVLLLITSGLLIRAVWRVQAVNPGFSSEDVLTLRTALPRPRYESPARRGDFYERVLAEVRALPGVESAAFTTGLPMAMTGFITAVDVPGQVTPGYRTGGVSHRWVTRQYFATMGIPLISGRDVEERDSGDQPWVAVVSTSFAERYWPDQDPIGRAFTHRGRTRTVVGVVGDVKVRGLERTSEPQIYLPAAQAPERFPATADPKDLVVRHAGPPESLIAAVREIVRAVDPEQPLSNVRTMDEVLAGETASRRGQLHVLALLAIVAIVLSGIGIYGLLAFTVSQRSSEIAVRLALGANPSAVGRMIFADGMRLALAGVVPGVLVAYAAGNAMRALLFGIAPADPATFGAAVALALLSGATGAFLPALRAVHIEPGALLRGA
jgi:predicted permease